MEFYPWETVQNLSWDQYQHRILPQEGKSCRF